MGSVFGRQAVLKPWQPKPRLSANKPKTKHEENDLQMRIARYIRREYPDIIFISSGNGLKKSKAQAGIWKMINSEKGQPDMLILCARQGYCGIAMELKKEGFNPYKKDGTLKKQTVKVYNKYGVLVEEYNHLEKQADRLLQLNKEGWLARFVFRYDDFVRLIDGYMGRPKNTSLF